MRRVLLEVGAATVKPLAQLTVRVREGGNLGTEKGSRLEEFGNGSIHLLTA